MVTIKIDGKEFEVDETKNLIDAVREVGEDIPYFCYHPALKVVGMCRMCLIEIEGVPKLQAACNTPVKAGLSIITKSARVKEAREGTMEFLLANHPLDCPVCDKAGECDLQDNAFSSGKGVSRFELKKRDVPQEEIGENLLINHNRCIICFRCVRFEEEKVGQSNLGLFERGYHSLIGLAGDSLISHNYQGALSDICPTGALLNKKTLFKSRVWWYKTAKTVCHGCSTGCNVEANVRDNKMYRYMARENREQGMFFLCDTGRFDVDWMNENRLQSYMENGNKTESSSVFSSLIPKIKNKGKIAILGGAHESNENLNIILTEIKKWSNTVTTEARVHDSQYNETKQVDFLLTEDRHPNTKGAVEAGFISTSKASGIVTEFNKGSIDVLFIIKESIPEGLDLSKGTVVVLETNLTDSAKKAGFAVPIKTFSEQVGSFTNKNGIKQNFEMAMNPILGLPSSGDFFKRLNLEMAKKKEEALVGNR
ncbi:MAG: (2Fe-2S)-binding protein [Leptospiraceae bacterium]|nr:(2Fe-2S)-binding protein [Leptospiraceae bacterium]MCP5512400.1 (2Fe-2S)-binding protein [Leptospiraceae bacterium]